MGDVSGLKHRLGRTKVLAKKSVRYIIDHLKPMEIIERNDSPILFDLIGHHPNKSKVNGVVGLWYGIDATSGIEHEPILHVVYQDGTKDSISWNKCLDALWSSKANRAAAPLGDLPKIVYVKAFRRAIHNTSRGKFLEEHDRKRDSCSDCGAWGVLMHVDHDKTPFTDIYDEFMCYNKPIELVKHGVLYDFKDKETKQKWIEFHDQRATYKLLCVKCNMTKGASEIVKRRQL